MRGQPRGIPVVVYEIGFDVPGEPVAKQRPRLGRAGNVYTPAKTRAAEESVGWAFKTASMKASDNPAAQSLPWTGQVAVFVEFLITRDKDLDNMVKTVLDGLNGVAWNDDNQVVEITASKEQSSHPGTLVTLGFVQ